MRPASLSRTSIFIAALAFLWTSCWSLQAAWSAPKESFAAVKWHLKKEGFPTSLIAATYRSHSRPLLKNVARSFHIQESKLNYGQFLSPASLASACRFLEGHKTALLQAEKHYGVDRYTIVAILLIESHFGEYTGRTPTLEILSSFALLQQTDYRKQVWRLLSPQDRKRWGWTAFNKKARQRAQWAYKELTALMLWAQTHPDTVDSFRGSSMGAIGWPQFLPSSLLHLGVDGNKDGKVDLYQSDDAIFSVANYLRAHGWNQAETRTQKTTVIYAYNHSQPYVNTVLGVAARLRQKEMKAESTHAP